MMNTTGRMLLTAVVAVIMSMVSVASADGFGASANQFTIDFITISGDTNPASGYGIVNNDYRMGIYEITNDQWSKFKTNLGVSVTGDPSYAYDESPYYTGTNVPTTAVSWCEAAQFVNWLNTSTGHQAAYKFTGTQGTSNYALATWSTSEAAGGTNLYRHKDAFYYMPTENEWVKAGYWNGTALQTYTTKSGETLFQGDATNGGWNYNDGDDGPDGPAEGPWDVGSGSEELNGTFGMMGNLWEWMENPYSDSNYGADSERGLRGGSFCNTEYSLASSTRYANSVPSVEGCYIGFRVASEVPEPCSLGLLLFGGLALLRRRRG